MARKPNGGFDPAESGVAGESPVNAGVTSDDSGNVNNDTGGADPINGFPTFDPAAIFNGEPDNEPATGNGDNGTSRRKRGRPKGSGSNSNPKAAGKVSLAGVESLLISSHAMLSVLVKTPELKISQAEAHMMIEAGQEVARFYPVEMDPKKMAWANLIMVLGGIYGPRAMAIHNNRKGSGKRTIHAVPDPARTNDAAPASKPNGVAKTTNMDPSYPSQVFGFSGPGDIELN